MGLHQSLSSCAAAASLFGEGVVPNSHPGPLLTQLKAINYLLSYCSFGEDASPDLAAASIQAAVGSDVVPPSPPDASSSPDPAWGSVHGSCRQQLSFCAQRASGGTLLAPVGQQDLLILHGSGGGCGQP